MTLEAGQTLLHYRLIEKIGEGGMGVVWKALDTTLDREVAIKALPADFASNPERLARFEREAKLLASLNHPNIAGIYGLHEADGSIFLAMECIAGEDLAGRLRRGPLALDAALAIARQITEALEAAHENGIVHRDLKPANVRLTSEGHAKVLDFGLAKAIQESGEPTESPTLTSAGTKDGLILGTAQYMSPEQARGKPVDKRTDIFSFGCVLYECLVGRPAFGGETISDTLASILTTEADGSALPAGTPPRIRELIARCLEKDPRNRLRDIGDARFELQGAQSGASSISGAVVTSGTTGFATGAATEAPRRSRKRVVVALLAGVVLGAAIWAMASTFIGPTRSGSVGVSRFSVTVPHDLKFHGAYDLSPDGRSLFLIASPGESDDPLKSVYLRSFGDFELRQIAGTERAVFGTISPDGEWLAVVAPVSARSSKLRLSKIRIDGSAPPQSLLVWQPNWANQIVWTPDDELLTTTAGSETLIRVPMDGSAVGSPIEIRTVGFGGYFRFQRGHHSVLPDRKHVLGVTSTYGSSGYEESVTLVNIETGEARILVENGKTPNYLDSGHLLFSRGETLMAVPFDSGKLETTGAQVAITDGLRANAVWEDAYFSLSRNGTLAYRPGGVVGGSRKLVYLDGEYNVIGPWSEDLRPFESNMVISPDGKRLAVTQVNPGGLYDIWVSDVDRPRLTQLVRTRGKDSQPLRWSPDGRRLVYSSISPGAHGLYLRAGDGSDEPEALLEWTSESEQYEDLCFLNEPTLIVTYQVSGESELLLLPLEANRGGVRELQPLLKNARNPRVSLDGRWLSYVSDKSGRDEVYVRRLRNDRSLGQESPVTRRGCGSAWWARGPDAEPLQLNLACASSIYSASISATPDVRISEPKLVADVRELERKYRGDRGLLPDGRYIAVMQGGDEDQPSEVRVVLNWFDELQARLQAAQ